MKLFPLLLVFAFFLLAITEPAQSVPIDRQEFQAKLKLTIADDGIEALVLVEIPPHNDAQSIFILLPFVIDREIANFPSAAICSFEVVENHYTVFSAILPAEEERLEIRAITRRLATTIGDLQEIKISFKDVDLPSSIANLLNQSNSISYFESLEVTFPPEIDLSQVTENPHFSNSSGNTHLYEMSRIMEQSDGLFLAKYPIGASYWFFEMTFSAIIGIAAAFALSRIPIRRDTRIRFLFLVPILFVFFWAAFSTLMLLTKGPTWDYLSKYYVATIEIAIAMGLWLKSVFRRAESEGIKRGRKKPKSR